MVDRRFGRILKGIIAKHPALEQAASDELGVEKIQEREIGYLSYPRSQ